MKDAAGGHGERADLSVEADKELRVLHSLSSNTQLWNGGNFALLCLLAPAPKKDHRGGRILRQGIGGLCRVTGAKADTAVLVLRPGAGAGVVGAWCRALEDGGDVDGDR